MAVIDLNSWQDAESELLTESEREELKNLDSRSFGQQAFSQQPEGVHLKLLLEKAINELEDKLSILGKEAVAEETEITDTTIFLNLGHYSLLLQRFPQALSAYQKYYSHNKESWNNAPFLYGLAIVYFHYNSFQWSIRAFQQVLYADQSFSKAKDVHLFLAILFKNTRDFQSCKKHFYIAQCDSSFSNLLTYFEIKFHETHAEELQGNYLEAKKSYEDIIVLDGIDNRTKGLVLKQLGWLHETVETVEEFGCDFNTRVTRAVEYYQQSIDTYPEDGEVYYYLGRCNAALGDVQSAFSFYRSAIDKRESCPDTWCSIGVLYQQQSQPSDALQAFICAVQLDEGHVSAWLNLGILYESEKQFRDAFICYQNAARRSKELGESLRPRLEALRAEVMASHASNNSNFVSPSIKHQNNSGGSAQQSNSNVVLMAAASVTPGGSSPRKLHSIDEAWNLPIPAELTSRRKVKNSKRGSENSLMGNVGGSSGGLVGGSSCNSIQSSSDATKRLRTTQNHLPTTAAAASSSSANGQAASTINNAIMPTTPFHSSDTNLMTVEQEGMTAASFPSEEFEMMKSLEHQLKVTGMLQPSSQIKLAQLQQKFQQFLSNQKRLLALSGNNQSAAATVDGMLPTYHHQSSSNVAAASTSLSPNNSNQLQSNTWHQQRSSSTGGMPAVDSMHGGGGNEIKMETTDVNCSSGGTFKTESGHPHPHPPSDISAALDLTDTLNVLHSMVGTTTTSYNSSDIATGQLASKSNEAALKPKCSKPKKVPPSIHIHLSDELIKAVQNYDNGTEEDIWSVFNVQLPPPLPPVQPLVAPSEHEFPPESPNGTESDVSITGGNTSWLHPPTPTVTVESKREAYSEKLMEYVLLKNQPVTVIRGLINALKIDLSLFTTKSLCEFNPEHPVEVRNQINQPPDENWGGPSGEYIYQWWPCESSKSSSTITKYAHYQVSKFVSSQQEAASNSAGGNISSSPSSGNNRNSPGGTRCSSPEISSSDYDGSSPAKSKRGRKQKFKPIQFGTNVDLSDEKKWGPQLHEISKLPIFCRLVSAANMLSHLPYTILGMNSVQLYMKVPGCRTPGHQENLNFCSVNINIGPGNCEWFSVDTPYWGVIQRLCERNNTNFLHGSWWPLLEDLELLRVPVYRFIQRPGDLVFINAGVVHWVQSTGFCNNIAWNVGPLNGYQYSLAVERYEWNKLQNYRSLVPMITLTWNLARNVRITDESLYFGMKSCLIKSLKYNELCLEELKNEIKPPVEIRWHGRQHGELVNFCATCDQEVFNILYTKQQLAPAITSVIAPGDVVPVSSNHMKMHPSECTKSSTTNSVTHGQGGGGGSSKKTQVYVYCRSCALRVSPTLQHFVILQEYKIEDLTLILDHFRLKVKEPTTETTNS